MQKIIERLNVNYNHLSELEADVVTDTDGRPGVCLASPHLHPSSEELLSAYPAQQHGEVEEKHYRLLREEYQG